MECRLYDGPSDGLVGYIVPWEIIRLKVAFTRFGKPKYFEVYKRQSHDITPPVHYDFTGYDPP